MTQFVDIGTETARIVEIAANPVLLEDGDSFNIENEGAGYCWPWMSTGQPYVGTKSLVMRLDSNQASVDVKDRIELSVVHAGDTYEYHFGQDRFFGFAMLINNSVRREGSVVEANRCKAFSSFDCNRGLDVATTPMIEQVHFAQWYQGNAAVVGGVPLVLTLMPGFDPPQWRAVANDQVGGGYTVVANTPITRGVWHTFVIEVKANPNSGTIPGGPFTNTNGGICNIWCDGVQVGSSTRDLGTAAGFYPTPNVTVTDNDWMVRCGQYRPTNSTVVVNSLALSFDQIRYGTTYADVI